MNETSMMQNRIEEMICENIRFVARKAQEADEEGRLDFAGRKQAKKLNPRFQESCLTLSAAVKLRVGLPQELNDADLEKIAERSVRGWLSMQSMNGCVTNLETGKNDPLATAYGVFAVARTINLLGDLTSSLIRVRAKKGLFKAARYLSKLKKFTGLHHAAVILAAIKEVEEYTTHPKVSRWLQVMRTRYFDYHASYLVDGKMDVAEMSLALAYLTLSCESFTPDECGILRKTIKNTFLSLTPSGMMGGGVESRLTSLPIPTGFYRLSGLDPSFPEQVSILYQGWQDGYYDDCIDPSIPELTPLPYLLIYGLSEPSSRDSYCPNVNLPDMEQSDSFVQIHGRRESVGDWLLRLNHSGSIGWLYHQPSRSCRIFSGPGELREGPSYIDREKIFHPGFEADTEIQSGQTLTFSGNLTELELKSPEFRSMRMKWFGNREPLLNPMNPLVPFEIRHKKSRKEARFSYSRSFQIKEDALVIEHTMEKCTLCRLPVIWNGSSFGSVRIGSQQHDGSKCFEDLRVRELILQDDHWPRWSIRFTHPVNVVYTPLEGLPYLHGMRFLSLPSSVFDLYCPEEFHMTIRVG